MIPSIPRKLASILVISCLLQPCTFAYCNTLPRLICAEYSQSQLVVIAKLKHKRYFPAKNGREGFYIYSLETSRTLRGKVGATFRVYEENSSGRASFNWNIGKSYLLFLNSTDDGMWWLYGCGNSVPLENAGFALKVIESMNERHGGLIQGLIIDGGYPRPVGNTELAGITVEVRDEKNQYKTVTNSEGAFKIHVPPGRYTVSPVRSGWTFKKDIESYEDPGSVNIANGGGAQVQFEREMKK
jgi:hypothetical protein